MFELFWTFGFILNGAPNIQKMKDPRPTEIEECLSKSHDAVRMVDWMRGVLRQPLEFPIAVYGECEPVRQDATQRPD
jgi:hypothetical protein